MTSFLDKNIAVYGGSFNPPTMGHYQMIKKASSIFDVVYVVIASNADKKEPMFTVEERLAMLKDMAHSIDPSDTKIAVAVLPAHTYLANYAYQMGARFLIRGIRDQIDFGFEQNIYRTNRRIQPKVETIYLMPDDAYSLVSSSWIRGLVGCNGWVDVIRNSVTPFVLSELKKNYLKKIFFQIAETLPLSHYLRSSPEEVWEQICAAYGSKKYHGFDHLLDLIEALNEYKIAPDPLFLYAIFMHDINPSEEESAKIACSHFRMFSRSLNQEDPVTRLTRLIMATKHVTCDYAEEDSRLIASLDLLVLASDNYEKYVDKVYGEYYAASGMSFEDFNKAWNAERAKFLQKMLERRVIYPDSRMAALNEIARANMQSELNHLLSERAK